MVVPRALRFAAAAVAFTLLAACSSGGDDNATGAGSGAKHLTVWFPGTDPAESALVKNSLVPEFEKSTGATVDVTYVDYANLSNKLAAAFAAGTAPDVFGHGRLRSPTWSSTTGSSRCRWTSCPRRTATT